jgi:hypothetical protein
MDETGDCCGVDEVLPILSPEEAFAPVLASERFEVTTVDGELVLVDLPGADVRYFLEAVYQDERWELLYWGTDPGAAWALARRVSAAYHVPIRRRKGAPRPAGGGALHLH